MPDRLHLARDFFDRPTLTVARELLGTRLVHIENGVRIVGVVTETEAYIGQGDLACHARAGRTPRTQAMFGAPGHAYVYFTYGMHWMFNCVTEPEGFPAAVLVRALEPLEGLGLIGSRRGKQPERLWTNGPAKICQAFEINGDHNGIDLCTPSSVLFFEAGEPIPEAYVTKTPRVGLNTVPEPWKSLPWNFKAKVLSEKQVLSQ